MITQTIRTHNLSKPTSGKRAKILATLGPASMDRKILVDLIQAGVNAFRLNCSHASLHELSDLLGRVRHTSAAIKTPVAIMLDLQGPRLRTGRLRSGEPVLLKAGRSFVITTEDVPGTEDVVSTNYHDIAKAVSKGSRILLDEGHIELRVAKANSHEVQCEVAVGGILKEHKGINLPGARIDLPSITVKDRRDLEWGLSLGVDYVALSFVKDAADVHLAQKIIRAKGGHSPLVIAKIERPEAIARIHSILDATHGIMVARGDLGVELSASDVPVIQKLLVDKASEAAKTVIVATQMLESMITHPIPTRAEASDVANAIFDGADAVMLSAETAVGRNPVAAVRVMSEIISKAESSPFIERQLATPPADDQEQSTHFVHALARAASEACEFSHAKAIVVFTLTGWSARIMAKYRPRVPIYALTPIKEVRDQLSLQWGITPVLAPLHKSTDAMIQRGERIVMGHGYLKKRDVVIVMAGGTAKHRASNMIKIHPLGNYS